jgi:hypothetical protein
MQPNHTVGTSAPAEKTTGLCSANCTSPIAQTENRKPDFASVKPGLQTRLQTVRGLLIDLLVAAPFVTWMLATIVRAGGVA